MTTVVTSRLFGRMPPVWALVALLQPAAATAQVDWTATVGAFVNPQPGRTPTRRGAAAILGAAGPIGQHARWSAEVAFGRTDFYVLADELHTLIGTGIAGIQLPMSRSGTEFGVMLGGGVYVEDDISETDPQFVSSAHWTGTVAPGVRLDQEINDRLDLTILARDYVTGMFDSVFLPEESRLHHHFVIAIGVRF